ncbi:MAG: tyrosine-type recombinase/integrase [Oscillospiraceae bacterium]|nr:tyrosine-type recombinase/integrase [Oscillospiraceae bacterium]MBR4657028.1 tyrosine-type recombinase/integrase [Oscillospiraceae bacterium]
MFDDYVKDCDLSRKTDEERAFSDKEISALKEDAEKTPLNPRSLMTLFAMETGLRAGELAALHRSDIEDGFIHVHRQQLRDKSTGKQTFVEVCYTKDERKHPHDGRYVPITKACAEVIRLTEALPGDSEYVFHDRNGNPVSKDSYEQNLRRRCERLGIETSHNHAFRVAFNGRLIDMGFGAADRALILGHAVETNERHYSRSDRRRLDTIRQRLAPLVE